MKKSFLLVVLFCGLFLVSNKSSDAKVIQSNLVINSEEWTETTGKHSDGTTLKIRYQSNYLGDITSIEIYYNGSWSSSLINWEKGRRYVKTPLNKRYYF